MPSKEYTVIEGVHVCNDCGAHGSSPDSVEHYSSCNPGESERWKEFYDQPECERA